MRIPLATGNYLGDGERHINLAPVFNALKKDYELHGTEGLASFITTSSFPVRGLYVMSKFEETLFIVAGGKFYRADINGVVTEKGSLNTSAGRVGMADNGFQLMIVDGSYGYIYTKATDTFAQIGDLDFPGAESVIFKDGLFVTVDPNSQIGRTCALYDGTDWDGLDFASAEGDPDPLVAVGELGENVWFFGKTTTEIFYNAGLVGFPFQRRSGGVLDFGLAAKHSLAKNNQAWFFLARTTSPQGERVVVMVRDFTPQIISTQGMHEAMATFPDAASAEGLAYMVKGHAYYALTFPDSKRTFVYDAAESMWHERSSRVSGDDTQWRARVYAFFGGFHLVGDYSNGNVYKLKSDAYDENGEAIIHKLITPELIDMESADRIGITRLVVPMKTGVGVAGVGVYEASLADGSVSADGSIMAGGDFLPSTVNPVVMLRVSHDGAQTWGNERRRDLGALGERNKQFPRFERLGSGYRWNIELVVTDAVEVKFTGALIVGG